MTFEQREAQVPEEIRRDPLWKSQGYQLSLFLGDLAWPDAMKLVKNRLCLAKADQLYRAASNISSNVTEGYSRSSPADRARFYEYALGSVRETRDWYYKARRILSEKVVNHRIGLSSELIAILVAMITNERRRHRRIGKRSPDTES